jgi:hypothetical protein
LENSAGHRSLYGLNSNPSAFGMKIKAYGFRDDYGGATFPSIEGISDANYIVQVSGEPASVSHQHSHPKREHLPRRKQ